MKSIFLLGFGLFFSAKSYSQQPVFLSPYKSGKPVAESVKDYSKPVCLNQLADGGNKSHCASKTLEPKSEPANETKPVMQSSSKKNLK